MGTLTSVTDANGQTTTAEYDGFGRMRKLARPGDSSAVPTAEFKYWDSAQPFRYEIFQYEAAGNPNLWRSTIKYYDGLGREIQTKLESQDVAQQVVTDRLYDGLGQVRQHSQPRYVAASGSAFWGYTPLASDGVERWTTTAYDGLGRPTGITAHDGSGSTIGYFIVNGRRGATTTDPNGHKTRREADMFGRLRQVNEFSGNGGTEGGYLLYASTSYSYNPLDLLTQVSDGNGKLTSISYDSLGRKTSMSDPTMGGWSYGYDVNGNLKTQTDARGSTISFSYDTLERLTNKSMADGSEVNYDYDEPGVPNGKGQRTRAERLAVGGAVIARTYYWYTGRGEVAEATYSIGGLANRTLRWTYDSGGRLSTQQYPSG